MEAKNATCPENAPLTGAGASLKNQPTIMDVWDSAAEVLAVAFSCWTMMYAREPEGDLASRKDEYWWLPNGGDAALEVAR